MRREFSVSIFTHFKKNRDIQKTFRRHDAWSTRNWFFFPNDSGSFSSFWINHELFGREQFITQKPELHPQDTRIHTLNNFLCRCPGAPGPHLPYHLGKRKGAPINPHWNQDACLDVCNAHPFYSHGGQSWRAKPVGKSRRTSPVALHTVPVINRAMQAPEALGESTASKNYQDLVSNKQDLPFIALSYSILLGNLRCGEDVLRYQRRSRHLPTRAERREWKSCSLIFLLLKVSSAWY